MAPEAYCAPGAVRSTSGWRVRAEDLFAIAHRPVLDSAVARVERFRSGAPRCSSRIELRRCGGLCQHAVGFAGNRTPYLVPAARESADGYGVVCAFPVTALCGLVTKDTLEIGVTVSGARRASASRRSTWNTADTSCLACQMVRAAAWCCASAMHRAQWGVMTVELLCRRLISSFVRAATKPCKDQVPGAAGNPQRRGVCTRVFTRPRPRSRTRRSARSPVCV